MTTNDQIAQWLDGLVALPGDDLYPGYIRKLRFPSWSIDAKTGPVVQELAEERGWFWVSLSQWGVSFMYRADLLEAEEEEQAQREREAAAQDRL